MLHTIHRFIAKITPHLQSAVLLFTRITMGWAFYNTGHGKLMNPEKTASYFAELHIPAPEFNAFLAGSTEMCGGLLLLAGFATRIVSVPLAFTMVVAYLTAHREDAFKSLSDFTDQAPFLFLLAAMVTMAFGAGYVSLDRLLKPLFDKHCSLHKMPL